VRPALRRLSNRAKTHFAVRRDQSELRRIYDIVELDEEEGILED
jgi:hypothetical protein